MMRLIIVVAMVAMLLASCAPNRYSRPVHRKKSCQVEKMLVVERSYFSIS